MYKLKYILKRLSKIPLFFIMIPLMIIKIIISVLLIPIEYPIYKTSIYYKDNKDKYYIGITKELYFKVYNYLKKNNLSIEFINNKKIYYLKNKNNYYLINSYRLYRSKRVKDDKIEVSINGKDYISKEEFIKRIKKKLNIKGNIEIINKISDIGGKTYED